LIVHLRRYRILAIEIDLYEYLMFYERVIMYVIIIIIMVWVVVLILDSRLIRESIQWIKVYMIPVYSEILIYLIYRIEIKVEIQIEMGIVLHLINRNQINIWI